LLSNTNAMMTDNTTNEMEAHNSVAELWKKNDYFMQCLRDFSEDLIYYVFTKGSYHRRTVLPKCLIGFY
jgi:hypothetical protein